MNDDIQVKVRNFLQEASEWLHEITYNDIPPLSIESAKLMLIDTLAAALNSLSVNWAISLISNHDIIDVYPMLSVMFDYDSTLLYYGHLGHGIIAPILYYYLVNKGGLMDKDL